MIARDPATRPGDAFAARRALLALAWPSAIQPAAPRTRERAPQRPPPSRPRRLRPGRDGLRSLDPAPLRARAARRATPGREPLRSRARGTRRSRGSCGSIAKASRIWLEPAKAARSAARSRASQVAELRAALEALHAAGIAHGHIDRDHISIDDSGAPLLRFTPSCDPTATIDRDRLALTRLGESVLAPRPYRYGALASARFGASSSTIGYASSRAAPSRS